MLKSSVSHFLQYSPHYFHIGSLSTDATKCQVSAGETTKLWDCFKTHYYIGHVTTEKLKPDSTDEPDLPQNSM